MVKRRRGRTTNTLHPLASLDMPPSVRRSQRDGPTAVAKAEWRDPDDVTPNASRYAREITGWRTYDPLRKMMVQSGSQVTTQHVAACDMLRQAADVAALGYSGLGQLDGVPVTDARYGPKAGPASRSIAQVRALAVYQRAMRLFICPGQIRLIHAVILGNSTLQRWCLTEGERLGCVLRPGVEMGRLLSILDMLGAHFGTDIEEATNRGELLPA
jgi:hypothetical protein